MLVVLHKDKISTIPLSKIKFTVVRYDLPSEFYMTEASRLASGAVFKSWFPNYSVQACTSVPCFIKQDVNRTSISMHKGERHID